MLLYPLSLAQRPFYFDVQNEDAAEYIRAGKAQDRALFFSWPAGVMHCIEHYTGDTIFWVGEDATEELKLYASFRDLWIEVHRMKMPRWLTVHDEFVVYKRKASMS